MSDSEDNLPASTPAPALRSRRELLIGALLVATAGVTLARMPNRPLNYLGNNKLESIVPKTIGRWKFVSSSGLVVPTEDLLALTLYSQQLTRVYWDGVGEPIMLLIAAGNNQTGFLQVHRPEICYAAGGYTLGEIEPQPLAIGGGRQIIANKLQAQRGGQSEWLLYWTRVGTQIPSSWARQRLAIAFDNLHQIIPDAMLIRTSTIMQDGDAAERVLSEFAQAMIASVAPSLRRALVT